MSDEPLQTPSEGSAGKWILLVAAVIYIAVSVYFLIDMHGTVTKLSKDQDASKAQIAQLTKREDTADAATETVAKQVGLTKRELAERAAQLQRDQRAAEARLAEEQKLQISAVSGDIAGVKTDVGGVKTDVASTKATPRRLLSEVRFESNLESTGLVSVANAATSGIAARMSRSETFPHPFANRLMHHLEANLRRVEVIGQ